MFGAPSTVSRNETETEQLRRELREAEAEIDRLRRALGSNHPLGLRAVGSLFG